MRLKQIFIESVLKYSSDISFTETLWSEIQKNYSNKKRFYHTLAHLENLYNQLIEVKKDIEDWDTILFTLYYHDIIYNPGKKDNESKSAEVAKERLLSIKFPADKISKCVAQILATSDHLISNDNDTNLFTDADLSILGQSWDAYSNYSKQVRKEYSIYPDFLYNSGRKKMLNHFLNMDRIFKTNQFFSKFENAARQNLTNELKQL